MKENLGKILLAIVAIAFIIGLSMVFKAIFSSNTNIDMFVVWLIFVAEGFKILLKSSWNTVFCVIGSIMLLVWIVYYALRIFTTKGGFKIKDDDIELDVSEWDQKKEDIFQRYGSTFWKIGLAFWTISLAMDFTATAIPTAKQSAAIYIIPKIVNNVNMREIPDNLAKLANEGIKELIGLVKGSAAAAAKEAVEATKGVAKDAVKETVDKAKEKISGGESKK